MLKYDVMYSTKYLLSFVLSVLVFGLSQVSIADENGPSNSTLLPDGTRLYQEIGSAAEYTIPGLAHCSEAKEKALNKAIANCKAAGNAVCEEYSSRELSSEHDGFHYIAFVPVEFEHGYCTFEVYVRGSDGESLNKQNPIPELSSDRPSEIPNEEAVSPSSPAQ